MAAHGAIAGFGAGCMWEMMDLISFGQGRNGDSAAFPLSAVRDVRIGSGWARNGLWLILLPYVTGIDNLAQGLCVSFEAPDNEAGGDVVYALHMRSPEEAQALAKELTGN